MSTLVIGAGPAGLATAACLRRRGVEVRLVDRDGVPGGAYRSIYEGIRLASPVTLLGLPGLELGGGPYISTPEYRAYLERYAAHHGLAVERGTVERVERRATRFDVTVDGVAGEARAVVVATGMWDHPVVPPALPGVRALHARDWRGAAAHPEKDIVIVGGATSAVEIAEELGRAGRRVIVSARRRVRLIPQRVLGRDLQEWLTPLERAPAFLWRRGCERRPTVPATDLGFSAMRARGLIDVRPAIARAAGNSIEFVDGSRAPVELVVWATGYRYETPFLPAEVARAPGGQVRAARCESVSWAGLFVVGAPCAGRITSELVRGVRLDSEDVAARIAEREARA